MTGQPYDIGPICVTVIIALFMLPAIIKAWRGKDKD